MKKFLIVCLILSFGFISLVLAQEDPKVEAQKAYNEGLAFLKKNKRTEAITKLKEAIAMDPDLAVAYYALGIAYKGNKDKTNAEAMFKKTIEKDDKFSPAYNALGFFYSSEKKYDAAINTFKASLGINANDKKANFGLGYVYLQKKDYRNGIQYFQKAVEAKENYSKAWVNLGICHHEVRQYNQAVEAFGMALTYEKKRTAKGDIYLRLGNSLLKLKRNEDAILAYNDAISSTTKSYVKGAANFGLGEIYKKNGNKQLAVRHFDAASKDRSWKQSALYELDLLNQ